MRAPLQPYAYVAPLDHFSLIDKDEEKEQTYSLGIMFQAQIIPNEFQNRRVYFLIEEYQTMKVSLEKNLKREESNNLTLMPGKQMVNEYFKRKLEEDVCGCERRRRNVMQDIATKDGFRASGAASGWTIVKPMGRPG
ncbi:hypothetical protein HPP92_026594 [Vanilla planifolia]|uniref:Uncharacterized protein n=1 Tax=Vanilla planifolia TaxID=51239 RepID=A0A835U7T3_VANPL|nr:hypothetical protein HPP92_026594 [Vanilla planifolia]